MISYIKNILLIVLVAIIFLPGCEIKSITTDTENLTDTALSWIPFNGSETVIFESDSGEIAFYGTGYESFYENVRYMSDQSGFFKLQEDYYAEMERRTLVFISESSDYIITYYLERNKSEVGAWDELRVTIADGFYYDNEIKVVPYKSFDWEFGVSGRKPQLNLNGTLFTNVYFNEQERRPQFLYLNQQFGVVGYMDFKASKKIAS
ncbi:MAG: hypothetical protein K8R53_12625 [Bacteroidales bacterium]|nr:hypothetical protein [Bacteroidales bacterium]